MQEDKTCVLQHALQLNEMGNHHNRQDHFAETVVRAPAIGLPLVIVAVVLH
jgi:hypothetical protein